MWETLWSLDISLILSTDGHCPKVINSHYTDAFSLYFLFQEDDIFSEEGLMKRHLGSALKWAKPKSGHPSTNSRQISDVYVGTR